MLFNRSRIIFLKHLKDFRIIRTNKIHNKFILNHCRPEGFTNAVGMVAPRLFTYVPVKNYSVQLKTDQGETSDVKKLEKIFSGLEPDKISPNDLLSIIKKADVLLDDILIEVPHGKEFPKKKWYITLQEAILKNLDQMSKNEIANLLNFYQKLKITIASDIYVKLIEKLCGDFENLSFSNKVHFWDFVCNVGINVKGLDIKFRENLAMRILNGIKSNEHCTSAANTAAAILFVFKNTKVSSDDKIKIVTLATELKNWSDEIFLKFFMDMRIFLQGLNFSELEGKLEDKLQKEILNSNKYIHYLLPSYVKVVSNEVVEYDKNFVDDIICNILKKEMMLRQLNTVTKALSELDHCHYGVVEHAINVLKKDSNIFNSHPILMSNIVKFITTSNMDQNEKYRWSEFRDILNSSNLKPMLKYSRNNLERYTYLLVELTTLEVFVDEELKIFSTFMNHPEEFKQFSLKHMRFIINVNQAVKLFHPSFTMPILSQDTIDFATKKLSAVKSKNFLKKLQTLQKVSNALEKVSNIKTPVIYNCYNKLGFRFAALIAVDKNYRLYSFNRLLRKFENIEVETIRLPMSFQLIALLPAFEREYCRNNLDLKAAISLEVKIIEKLGYPCVVLYHNVLDQLHHEKIGPFLIKKIIEVVNKNREESDKVTAQSGIR